MCITKPAGTCSIMPVFLWCLPFTSWLSSVNCLQCSRAIITGSQLDALKGTVLFCSVGKHVCFATLIKKKQNKKNLSVLHKHSWRALSSEFKVNFSLHLMMTCQRNVAGVDRTPQEEKQMLEMSSNRRKMKRGKLEKRAKWLSQRFLSWLVAFNSSLSTSKKGKLVFPRLCFKW